MTTLTMAEALSMALFCCLLGPALGVSSLHGLNSRRTRRGLLGGVLGGGDKGPLDGVLEGGDKGLLGTGGGVLSGVLGGGDKGTLGGVLGGGDKGPLDGVLEGGDKGLLGTGGGVLSGVLGGEDKGTLGGVLGGGDKGLLGTGGGVLGGVLGGGDKGGDGGPLGGVHGGGGLRGTGGGILGGVLGGGDGGLLGGVLGGGGLLGTGGGNLGGILGGENGLLGLGNGGLQEPFQWYNILNLRFIRGSWKIVQGTELILNLQAVMLIKLPALLFRTVTVDVNITANLAITEDKPGDLKLVLKNCQNLVAGFTIKLPPGLVASLVSNVVNSAIQNTLPAVLCPIFQVWINFINLQLRTLDNYVFFGLLGRIHTALSAMPISTGHFSELDLKDKPFPGVFLQWLLGQAKVNPMIA